MQTDAQSQHAMTRLRYSVPRSALAPKTEVIPEICKGVHNLIPRVRCRRIFKIRTNPTCVQKSWDASWMLVASCYARIKTQQSPRSLSQNLCSGNRTAADRISSTFSLLSVPDLSQLPPSVPVRIEQERFRSEPFYGLEPIQSCKNIEESFTEDGGVDPSHGNMKLTAGGLDEISYATRLIPATSFVIREDIFRRTSGGKTYLPKEERFRVKLRSTNGATG